MTRAETSIIPPPLRQRKVVAEGVNGEFDLLGRQPRRHADGLPRQHIRMRREVGADPDRSGRGAADALARTADDGEIGDLVQAEVCQIVIGVYIADQIVAVVGGDELIGIDGLRLLPDGMQLFIRAVRIIHKGDLLLVRHRIVELFDDIKDVLCLRTVQHIRAPDGMHRLFKVLAPAGTEFFDQIVRILAGNMAGKGHAVDEHSQLPVLKAAGRKIHPAPVVRGDLKARLLQQLQVPRHRLSLQRDPELCLQPVGDLLLRQRMIAVAVALQDLQNAQKRQFFRFQSLLHISSPAAPSARPFCI